MRIDEERFRKLLDAYIRGTATPAERALLDDFFASYPKDQEYMLADEDERQQLAWREALLRTRPGVGAARKSFVRWYVGGIAFLMVAVALVVVRKQDADAPQASPPPSQQTAQTLRGQKLKIELVDGTLVILNASSTLRFPEQFAGAAREVYLEGEAYFEVTHNAAMPFIVHTKAADTKVLGTSFNVKAANTTEITLVTGKVDVSLAGHNATEHLVLAPRQQAIIGTNQEHMRIKEVDVTAYVDWKDNVLHFDNITMREAADRLQTWYNVDIVFDNKALERCTIQATYTHETLSNVLKSFEYMLKIKIHQQGKKIVLSGKSCH